MATSNITANFTISDLNAALAFGIVVIRNTTVLSVRSRRVISCAVTGLTCNMSAYDISDLA